ncbi:MAG: hypothetical protein JSW39_12385 [Desulfobacterales bacterium]|nr:MAG: hypothetical protein JSW39_12385 [Desulfobacterales bacterium]
MASGLMALDTRQSALSFALSLVDDFTGKAGLLGQTTVTAAEADQAGRLNPSGYYVFMGLTGSNFTVQIRNTCYLDHDLSVDISALDPRLPLATTVVHPRYLYPFPAGSTLIMGRVTDSLQQPLAGVDATVQGSTVTNQSDPGGRFVLYFTGLSEDDVQIQDSRRLILVNDSTTLQLEVQRSGYQSSTVTIGPVEEGSTKLVRDPIVMVSS